MISIQIICVTHVLWQIGGWTATAGLLGGRDVVFSASDCVGHEAHGLAPESWGVDPRWVWFKNAGTSNPSPSRSLNPNSG